MSLLLTLFQVCAYLRGVDMLDGDDEIGREDFCGVDEQKRSMMRVLVFDPKSDDFAVAVQGTVDAHSAIRDLEFRDVRRLPRLQCNGDGCDEDEYCEKDIVEQDTCDCNGYRDDAERPIPIAPTLDVLVLVRAPAQNDILVGHSLSNCIIRGCERALYATTVGQGGVRPEAGQPWAEADMYYVYILRSEKNGKLYKGLTADLKRRVIEHNAGNSAFTSRNGPWKLVYYEAFLNKEDARREELFLKSGKGKERIKYLLTK